MTYQPGETRTVYDETTGTVRPVEVRRSGNTAAWLIAALVAVVAIIAVAFMVGTANREAISQEDLTTVAEQARAQGALEGAQAGYNAAASQVQSSYNAAAANAQLAADRSAAEARAAAAESRAATERARAEAAEAVSSATTPDSTQYDDAAPQ